MTNQEKENPKNFNRNFQNENSKPTIGGKSFFRAGQIFSIIYHLLLLAIIFILIQKGEINSAVKIFTINAAILIGANVLSTIERILFNKNKPHKRNFRRNNKNRS